jgi:hypothetical protein
MQRMRRVFAALVLTLALSLATTAGDIPGPGSNATCPSNQTCSQTTVDTPDPGISEIGKDSEATGLDPITEAILNLLQSLLSLF